MSRYFLPRAMAKIRVPVMGTVSERLGQSQERSVVEFECPVTKCRITRNDFNSADEASFTCQYDQIGVDPRLLSNAIVYLYIGDAPNAGGWEPKPTDLRFLGIMSAPERVMSDSAKEMNFTAVDYTTMFLSMKPYPSSSGTPLYSMTLRQAWQMVCDHTGFYNLSDAGQGEITSSVAEIRNNIRGLSGSDDALLDRTIGSGVLSRIAQFGIVQVEQHDVDAWAVWRACCDSLGLLTWIDADQCIVATAPDYYSGGNPAQFVYGINVKTVSESRDVASMNGKGIQLTSFDCLSGKTLESFFPWPDDDRVIKKRLPATKKSGGMGLAPVKDYEHQVYPYPCNQETLDDACQRVWEERSRQELEGHLTTSDMVITAQDGTDVDVLALGHGDQISVTLDPIALDEMRKLPSVLARRNYLMDRGYNAAKATLIARDQGFISTLLSTFVIREVTTTFDSQSESLDIDITYLSRINPNTGNAETTQSFQLKTVEITGPHATQHFTLKTVEIKG